MKDVWKVYFNGSFGGKSPDGSHPGQVLKLNQKFRFAGRDWYVPRRTLPQKDLCSTFSCALIKRCSKISVKNGSTLKMKTCRTMYPNRRSAKIRWLLSFRRKLS